MKRLFIPLIAIAFVGAGCTSQIAGEKGATDNFEKKIKCVERMEHGSSRVNITAGYESLPSTVCYSTSRDSCVLFTVWNRKDRTEWAYASRDILTMEFLTEAITAASWYKDRNEVEALLQAEKDKFGCL